ncbi:hypothetical protein UA08_04954 [Talaromyces atroroseus]|uniref:Uncharacterized protein n=1 Tax=Talaromyces atroroseus TaxID=1441469 RepID=A0A225AKQ1_TALAT|nr:hypothetical protein UA08_04954 [Talaromyces atroroseus]OKL59983.1 hypothetical protein UA08_04954 [Talaromyces atroroseus]
MRLIALLILLFGIAQTSAYSVPGGYERVLIYYMYSIDCQLNGGTPKKIATGCKGTGRNPCTLDQLLRYIAANPSSLPTRSAPATSYPALPDMDRTASALSTKGPDGRDFAGQIKPGVALPGASNDYSKFLSQLGGVAISFATASPDNANLLKLNIQAIRNTRRNAQLTTFKAANSDIEVATKPIPLYDGAPDGLTVDIIDAVETVNQNSALTVKELNRRWAANTAGGHSNNVEQLKGVLEDMEGVCS